MQMGAVLYRAVGATMALTLMVLGTGADAAPRSSRKPPPPPIRQAAEDAARAAADAADAALSVVLRSETPALTFEYSYPRALTAYPDLSAWLNVDRAAEHARWKTEAAAYNADRASAHTGVSEGAAPPTLTFFSSTIWSVEGEGGDFISLSRMDENFSGGAHGTSLVSTVLWDTSVRRMAESSSVFQSIRRAEKRLADRYCAQLDEERAIRREQSVADIAAKRRLAGKTKPRDDFVACPRLTSLDVGFASTDGQPGFAAIRLTANRYVAGPYVEGAYVMTVPLTAADLDLIKPRYRAAFRAAASTIPVDAPAGAR